MAQEHPQTAIALHAIGQELRRQARYDEALHHYRQALAVQRASLGAVHPHTASTLTAIGQLLHLLGRYAEALDHHRQALAIKREHLGPNHIYTANSLFDIGQSLQASGQRNEARSVYNKALAIQQRALGPHHPRTIATQIALAEVMLADGHFADALAHFRAVLAALEQQSRGDDAEPDRRLIVVLVGIGQALYQQNQHAEAITHFERALALAEPLSDAHLEDTLAILYDLGRARSRAGDTDGALVAFRRNLDGLRASHGNEHVKVAATLNAIGQVHYSRGDYRAALQHYQQALEIRQRLLGPDHWQTVSTRFNCGTARRELGDPDGRAEMEAAAAALERLLGPQHPHVLATKSWLR
ncbi:MAG TPA: tetratricopeptide repeat protein [Nannocystis sp.]